MVARTTNRAYGTDAGVKAKLREKIFRGMPFLGDRKTSRPVKEGKNPKEGHNQRRGSNRDKTQQLHVFKRTNGATMTRAE